MRATTGILCEDLRVKKGNIISERQEMLRSMIIVILTTILVSTGVVYLYDRYFSTRVVVFDLNSFVREQRTLFMEGKIDGRELERRFEELKERIDGLGRRVVVLTKESVVSGAEDISGEMEEYHR